MDGAALQNLISKGMGVAARRLGSPYNVYRPVQSCEPLSSRNRVIKLYASFNAQDEHYRRVSAYGDAVWWGVYDAAYTRPGDYMVGADASYFVAAQRPILPAQCVRTNEVVCVSRPGAPVLGGYGGQVSETAVPVITGWPASLLSQTAHVSGVLPDSRWGNWTMLLPLLPASLMAGDIVTTRGDRHFLIASAELSDLGWRSTLRQVDG